MKKFTLKRVRSSFICGFLTGVGGFIIMAIVSPGLLQKFLFYIITTISATFGALTGFFLEEVAELIKRILRGEMQKLVYIVSLSFFSSLVMMGVFWFRPESSSFYYWFTTSKYFFFPTFVSWCTIIILLVLFIILILKLLGLFFRWIRVVDNSIAFTEFIGRCFSIILFPVLIWVSLLYGVVPGEIFLLSVIPIALLSLFSLTVCCYYMEDINKMRRLTRGRGKELFNNYGYAALFLYGIFHQAGATFLVLIAPVSAFLFILLVGLLPICFVLIVLFLIIKLCSVLYRTSDTDSKIHIMLAVPTAVLLAALFKSAMIGEFRYFIPFLMGLLCVGILEGVYWVIRWVDVVTEKLSAISDKRALEVWDTPCQWFKRTSGRVFSYIFPIEKGWWSEPSNTSI